MKYPILIPNIFNFPFTYEAEKADEAEEAKETDEAEDLGMLKSRKCR